jgi:atypical dual specificity phosphatase
MQGRVRQAIRKIKSENAAICENTLRQELDMGPKEWNKFGKQVMDFVAGQEPKTAEMVLMIGLPGSGKSTIAIEMERSGEYVRVNQDEIGSRNACKKMVEKHLSKNKSVVIDRCNFSENQRKCWIDLAKQYGVSTIRALWIYTPVDVCIERAANRHNHPTIHTREQADRIIHDMNALFIPPSAGEGITNIVKIYHHTDSLMVVPEQMLVKPF